MRPGSLPSRSAAVALALLAAWPAILLAQKVSALVAEDRARIALAAGVLDGNSALARRLAAETRAAARANAFVQGLAWKMDQASPELLSAQLQRMIETMASSAGALVASSRTVAPVSDKGLERVGLDLDIAATLPALQMLLRDVEAARPAIFVDRLAVQVPESGSLGKAADGQDTLSVTLRLSVYGAGARSL
jgi:hypothetical protein